LNRRTVRRYVAETEPPAYQRRAHPAELSAEQLTFVLRRLSVCASIRATTLYREVGELGYAGSYPSFARRVRLLRVREPAEAEVRFETDPGVQTQIDWTELGAWPLGDEVVELKALVGILGFSRHVGIAFATDKTRETTLMLIPQVLHDLGGVTAEVLSDRDPALVIGETSDHRAIFAPEWLDLAASLGTTPRACRAYRAKTKGKVERSIREVKEDFLCWLTGQALPPRPSLFDYQQLADQWIVEVVDRREHRTTGRVVWEAWCEEVEDLRGIPDRLLRRVFGEFMPELKVIDLERFRSDGAIVEHRQLSDYESRGR
jgi:transposase